MTTAPVYADERVLKGVAATISAQFLNQHGDPADPGTVTVGVVDATGATVLAAGTATTGSGTGARTASLTSTHTASTAWLTATWTASSTGTLITLVEVVSRYYFTEAQARAHKHALMNSTTDYPTTQMRFAREEVEREFERVCWPFVPRYRRIVLPATGGYRLFLPDMHIRNIRSIREYASDGVTSSDWSASDMASIEFDPSGELCSQIGRTFGTPPGTVAVEYEYGFDKPDNRVIDAALELLRYRMNADRSGVPARAQTYTATEGGTYSLTVAGRGNAVTGIPDVDVILNDPRYRRPIVSVG